MQSANCTKNIINKTLVPADKPTIRDLTANTASRHQQSLSANHAHLHLIGRHDEGSRVVLECETQGGWPEPQLSWWRDGRLVDDSYEILELTGGAGSGGSGVDGPDDHLASDGSGRRVIERRAGAPDVQLGDSLEEFRARARLVGGAVRGRSEDDDPNLHLALEADAASDEDGTASSPGTSGFDDTDHQLTSRLATGGEHLAAPHQSDNAMGATTTPVPIGQNRLIKNRLELPSLSRADLLANYSCLAWNSRLGEPPSSYVMIDMNRKYLKSSLD